ncbi:MAG: O-antigen ligase family protein [Candidatus Roizmanbacteria bacterium]|nr:MAG: O-antigen ligase family protein [Candidatus Roizmanbacteria bacterium]
MKERKNRQPFFKTIFDLRFSILDIVNHRISNIEYLIIFVFILLLPTQLGKHFFFSLSYLSGVRIDYLAPTIYLTDIIAFLILFLNVKILWNLLKNKFFLIFIFLISLNILFSQVKPIAFYQTLKIIEILGLFFVFKEKILSLKMILFAFALGASFEVILSIMQFASKHSIQGIFYFFGERYFTLSLPDIAKTSLFGVEILRPYGTFSHPNSMGGFYLLIYFFVLTGNKFTNVYLKSLILFLSSILIFLSFSKIAIITYLFLNIIYLIKNKLRLNCSLCFFSRILVLIILALFFISAKGDILSFDKRVTLFQNALTIIWQNPLFGVGMGDYLFAQHQIAIKYPYFFLQPVHNIILLFLSEAGIILFGFVFYNLYKIYKDYKSYSFYYCFAAVLVTGMFDHYWLTLQQNLLLFPVIFGLLYRHKSTA